MTSSWFVNVGFLSKMVAHLYYRIRTEEGYRIFFGQGRDKTRVLLSPIMSQRDRSRCKVSKNCLRRGRARATRDTVVSVVGQNCQGGEAHSDPAYMRITGKRRMLKSKEGRKNALASFLAMILVKIRYAAPQPRQKLAHFRKLRGYWTPIRQRYRSEGISM